MSTVQRRFCRALDMAVSLIILIVLVLIMLARIRPLQRGGRTWAKAVTG